MKYIAFIPARGGSKRLPGKNIKLFCGKPLIYYSIIAALKSKFIQTVYVSTDDNNISSISESFGATVIRRPTELATDTATTSDALVHVMELLKSKEIIFDGIVTLQPSNPLRELNLIDNTVQEFENNIENIDSLITVCENHHKLGRIVGNSYLPYSYKLEERTQDIQKLYFENGSVYITKSETVAQEKSIFGNKIYPFITARTFGEVDIDTQEDFEIGEIIFNKYKNQLTY
ncbi:MAG: acylneuraminate cytidylyltransferase family protein [Bacteroidia bacterium]